MILTVIYLQESSTLKIHTHGSGSKTALLIHGLGSSSNSWHGLVQDLIQHDYTIYTPDMPGHGESIRDRNSYTVEKWETLLLEKIEKVDLIVGHSVGGLLALKVRRKLEALRTVAIDPLLRFPTGPLKFITQEIFGIQESGLFARKLPKLGKEKALWDRAAIRALVSPQGIPMPDKSVMVIRPKNSFVSPLCLLNKAPHVKVVTLLKGGHDLHHENYLGFFKEFKTFALN